MECFGLAQDLWAKRFLAFSVSAWTLNSSCWQLGDSKCITLVAMFSFQQMVNRPPFVKGYGIQLL